MLFKGQREARTHFPALLDCLTLGQDFRTDLIMQDQQSRPPRKGSQNLTAFPILSGFHADAEDTRLLKNLQSTCPLKVLPATLPLPEQGDQHASTGIPGQREENCRTNPLFLQLGNNTDQSFN